MTQSKRSSSWSSLGQATVEAALTIPLLMLLVLFMLQPGIVYYDKLIMQSAAAEGCRVLKTASPEVAQSQCEDFIRRRLGAIPQQDCFHVHDGSTCSYEIVSVGNEESSEVSVTITTDVVPLPLLDVSGSLLGLLDENGCFQISVSAKQQVSPDWVISSSASNHPQSLIGAWLP